MSDGTIAVGTSGWSYDDWAGAFYPADVPRSRWFGHYTSRFPTVEVNATFYRLPSASTIARWHDEAPSGFRFAVKGSRYITHIRRLADCGREVRRFIDRVGALEERLGAILWQLPPNLERNLALLEGFASVLSRNTRHVVEFRHPSWLSAETFDLLRTHRVAQASVSSSRMPRDLTVTTDFVYVRFHGLASDHAHDYSTGELRPWARFLRETTDRGLDGYAYFNNDVGARAPKNAADLTRMLGSASTTWPPEL